VSLLSLSLSIKFLSCLKLWCSSLSSLSMFCEQEPISMSVDFPVKSHTHDTSLFQEAESDLEFPAAFCGCFWLSFSIVFCLSATYCMIPEPLLFISSESNFSCY
jgi:hypothetical protein